MCVQRINRFSRFAVVVLAFLALGTVAIGCTQPAQSDEGALAHIFQLSIGLLLPMLLLFLVTADWRKPAQSIRLLALPGVTLTIAFAALYYYEHFH